MEACLACKEEGLAEEELVDTVEAIGRLCRGQRKKREGRDVVGGEGMAH